MQSYIADAKVEARCTVVGGQSMIWRGDAFIQRDSGSS
jgi:hypothetical protein